MLLTLFLLGLLYVAFVGALFAAGASAVMILVIAGGLSLAQLFLSDKLGAARRWAPRRSRRRRPPASTR